MTQQKWPPRHCPTAHFTSVLQPQQQMAGACWHLTITILLPFLIDCQILQFTCVHKCHQMSRKCQGLGHEDGPVTWSLCLRGDSCIVKLQRWRQLNSAGCVNKWDHFLRGFFLFSFSSISGSIQLKRKSLDDKKRRRWNCPTPLKRSALDYAVLARTDRTVLHLTFNLHEVTLAPAHGSLVQQMANQ